MFNRDANTTYYYVDGNLTASAGLGANGSQSLTPALVPNDTLIGSSGNGRWSGSGTMDDIGMWTRTLTADEVLAIFAEGGKGNPLTKAVAGSAVKPSIANPRPWPDGSCSIHASTPGCSSQDGKIRV